MGDVVHRPALIDTAEATEMLLSSKSAKLVTGFRGSEPIDIARPPSCSPTRRPHWPTGRSKSPRSSSTR